MLEGLILFLLFFLLILIILSFIFYYRVKSREYYSSNKTLGDGITYTTTADNFHRLRVDGVGVGDGDGDLEFLPFYEDRKRKIRGKLVLSTYSSSASINHYRIRVMNGSEKLSEGIYEIKPNMDYNYINYKVKGNDNRKLTIEIQKYNKTSKTADTTVPTGINIVRAYGYYYY